MRHRIHNAWLCLRHGWKAEATDATFIYHVETLGQNDWPTNPHITAVVATNRSSKAAATVIRRETP